MTKTTRRKPLPKPKEGEVWSRPAKFSYARDKDGRKTDLIKIGTYETESGGRAYDFEGFEIRTVLAVVKLPRPHQRRVIYLRELAPVGRAAFGRKGPKCSAMSSFNEWRRGDAKMISEGLVDRALRKLDERAAAA